MNLDDFLKAFYRDDTERICFRAFKAKGAPDADGNRPQKLSATRKELVKPNGLLGLRRLNHLRGVYFTPNAGGETDQEITRFNAVFVENDSLTIAEQNTALDNCPVPTSIRVETKRSVHAYWLLEDGCSPGEWRDMQKRLIQYFDGDKSIKNPSRVMRLPFFMHLTYNERAAGKYEYKGVKVVQFAPERRYFIRELAEAFPEVEPVFMQERTTIPATINNGSRNNDLFAIAGSLRRANLGQNEILVTLNEVNRTRVNPPLSDQEVRSIAENAVRYVPGTGNGGKANDVARSAMPTLSGTALYGLAGEVVRTIEPHTESDNVALLVQLLAGFGCLIGRTAYAKVEADFHYMKLNVVLIGESSKGRKGTSWGQIRNLLCRVDETFADCVQDGLSSGEGLISHVRDPQTKKTAVKEKNRIVDYQDELVDEGAKEKRAFVVEPEFARVLRAMSREGNTLSSVIRQAWDSDRLRVLTKTPLKASDAHISIVGHITKEELLRNLDETDTANGFANRFLWMLIQRSKYLPEGGALRDSDLNRLVEKLHGAFQHSKRIAELRRDERARAKWFEIYPELSDGHPGLHGSVTSRAEAQVMRLACLYALLDCSDVVRLEHQDAALALWQYSEESARYIFGNTTGNKIADTLYGALLGAGVDGMSRTGIRDLFNRNASSWQIDAAVKLLVGLGKVEVIKEGTGGKAREICRVKQNDQNDINDQSAVVDS